MRRWENVIRADSVIDMNDCMCVLCLVWEGDGSFDISNSIGKYTRVDEEIKYVIGYRRRDRSIYHWDQLDVVRCISVSRFVSKGRWNQSSILDIDGASLGSLLGRKTMLYLTDGVKRIKG